MKVVISMAGNNTWNYRRELSSIEQDYYENEWCHPSYDDVYIFEMLILEIMQAGLSWRTILHRREQMRNAFKEFNVEELSKITKKEEEELLKNPNIIRHTLKIQSLKKNSKAFLKVQREFGSFSNYIWGFTKGRIVDGKRTHFDEIPASTELSDTIAKDMRKRGFTFIGTTIIYSFLQSIGIVDDRIK